MSNPYYSNVGQAAPASAVDEEYEDHLDADDEEHHRRETMHENDSAAEDDEELLDAHEHEQLSHHAHNLDEYEDELEDSTGFNHDTVGLAGPPSSTFPHSHYLNTEQHTDHADDTDRDSSVSSRHSESHPFDQDVILPPDTPSSAGQPHTAEEDKEETKDRVDPGIVGRSVSDSSVPSSNYLSPPAPSVGLRKSVSIPEKLAGRAREIAVAQGRKLDHLVRGIDDVPQDYVEDHRLETLDYESNEDTMNELEIERSGALHSNYLLLLKVFMMILIGFITAMLMYCVSQASSYIFNNKITATLTLIQSGQAAGAYFAFLFMNLAITAVASSLVAILSPNAKGGGVPYALSYLNGTNVAEYFSPRIVAVKTLSLIFTISGGLTLGMEGPFVFIGGGVALLCSNFVDRVFPFFFITRNARRTFSRVIRNIREERVFMAGGLAAGLAVAFDAPIAGVLFALEGSTTFLTVPVVLRIFGCAMFASFFNDLGHNNFSAQIINHNLLTPTTTGAPPPWAFSIPELLPFTVLGIVGGFAGAGATWMNIKISHWRHHHMSGNTWKDIGKQIAEIALFSFVTSTIWFILPYMFGCRQVGSQCDSVTAGQPDKCSQLQCPPGFYSEIGAFVYASSDEIARLLFDRSLSYAQDYHVGPLICYGVAYWVLVSLIYGAYVPGGLFVPSIVVGGMYGRVIGIFLEYLFPNAYINPGVYALLGAASMLGGFTRLALPVVLMLIELTGDATYLLPIMYCAVVGKFLADYLYAALYPQHMKMEKIPTLTDQLNPIIAKLHAGEVMIKKERLACICCIERLSTIRKVLLTSNRVIFPVLTPAGELVGLIKRDALMSAEKWSRSYTTYAEAELLEDHSQKLRGIRSRGSSRLGVAPSTGGGASSSTLAPPPPIIAGIIRPAPLPDNSRRELEEKKWMTFNQRSYTNNAALSSSSFGEIDENYINLKAYTDRGMITAHPATSTKRLAIAFRRLGISHLCVVDRKHRFLGFVTRRCLIVPPEALEHVDEKHPEKVIAALQLEQKDAEQSVAQDQQAINQAQQELQSILREKVDGGVGQSEVLYEDVEEEENADLHEEEKKIGNINDMYLDEDDSEDEDEPQ